MVMIVPELAVVLAGINYANDSIYNSSSGVDRNDGGN